MSAAETENSSPRVCTALLVLYATAVAVQGLLLVENESMGYLKTNLIMQLVLVLLLAIWSYRASGRYLNAPVIFVAALYIWHSPFLTGHYFELAKIFAWTGRHFTYGEEYVPRAAGLVSLCLSAGVFGTLLGYRQQQNRADDGGGAASSTGFPVLQEAGKRIVWSMFIGYGLLTLVYFLKEGASALSGDYLSLYTEHPDTLLYRIYQATKFSFSLMVLALFAFVTTRREFYRALAVTLAIIALQFLLGSRSIPFINLIALALCIDHFIKKLPALLLPVGLLLMSAASFVIEVSRGEGILNVFSFSSGGREVDLLHFLWELGGVIRNVIRTMAFMGPDGPVHGQTFLNSLIYLLPKYYLDGLGFQPGIMRPSEWLIEHSADIPYGGGIGYSLVAEAYYNFGMTGCLLFAFIGWFVARNYFRFVFFKDTFSLLHALNLVIILSLHMRNDSEAYLRYIVYGSLCIELLRWYNRRTPELLDPRPGEVHGESAE
jgi:hypothetical protein